MNFNNSKRVDHKPMKFGTFVPYMYRFVIIIKYLTNFFKRMKFRNKIYPAFLFPFNIYNFDPLKPHFYIVKLGFTGVYIIILISA